MSENNKTITLAVIIAVTFVACLSAYTKDMRGIRDKQMYDKCIELHSPGECN